MAGELTPQQQAQDDLLAANECILLCSLGRSADADVVLGENPRLDGELDRADGRMSLTHAAAERRAEVGDEHPGVVLGAMARCLHRHRRWLTGAEEGAQEMQGLIQLWMEQRLWAENKVRELVVHDERHTRRVDLLATQLAFPLLVRSPPSLAVREAMALSCAAWLHDWGHEGGEISAALIGRSPFVAVTADEVRRLHGVLTRELLRDEWRARHGVRPDLASVTGILCAHHQRWTSFGDDQPPTVLSSDGRNVKVTPPSLVDDVRAHNAAFGRQAQPASELGLWNVDYERVRLMVALLRVADGCDVGVHRVPDAGKAKHAYLARAIQIRCRTARADLRGSLNGEALEDALDVVSRVAEMARSVAAAPLGHADEVEPGEGLVDRMLGALMVGPDVRALRELTAYVRFASEHAKYYGFHRRVANVWFDVVPRAPGAMGYDVTVQVWPRDGVEAREGDIDAVAGVHQDLVRELRDGAISDVEQRLQEAGLRFVAVCNGRTGKKQDL
jgi:hypothetical protein